MYTHSISPIHLYVWNCFQGYMIWLNTHGHLSLDGNGSSLLTPKIPCGFWTKLGSFGHSWRNHFPQKNQM
jgi:hypothetical protein